MFRVAREHKDRTLEQHKKLEYIDESEWMYQGRRGADEAGAGSSTRFIWSVEDQFQRVLEPIPAQKVWLADYTNRPNGQILPAVDVRDGTSIPR